MISIIIPIYNEELVLLQNQLNFRKLAEKAELIFVDGGSMDRSVELASEVGKVLTCGKGRALQMNFGAQEALKDILLFLHADNIISPDTIDRIEEALQQDDVVGGCLTQRIDNERFIFRLIEAQGNIRAKISKIFYGDQGIFVRKDVFAQIDAFPEVPVLEDVLFTQKLKSRGKTVVLKEYIFVSSRRWDNRGITRTIILYSTVSVMFRMGFSLDKIKARYEDLR